MGFPTLAKIVKNTLGTICRLSEFQFITIAAMIADNSEYRQHINNDTGVAVVPDYTNARPANYATLISSFIRHATTPRCLAHGGGNGRLTALLREGGVYGYSWDPMDGRRLAVWLIRSRHCLRGAGAHTRTSDDHGAGAQITQPVRRNAVFDVVDRSFATACNGPLVHRLRNGHVTIFTTQSLHMFFGTSCIGCRRITLIRIFIRRSRIRR